ncbi:toprim domain-containing protein [Xinfangfangia sp. CPCC 101601]|uniref:Toprim domain-containing protein n=1 Tax=Pseudogemmobacter lacusdianii TaxID=3069608 RepID=A0ABU0VTV1_9RHOB|nr:toprim domain-containing protein [Xinfangfangia sp. CPCC 101601]MDQ2065078.1 toprim domain-containing protein [Xinfangfangia sp. CPCC 101601]
MTEAQRITRALQGKWHGRYGLARCPAHGDRKPSLSLSDGAGGRLLARCMTGCDFMAVLDALRGLGIIEGHGTVPRTDAAELARFEAEQRREAEKRERQAQSVWSEALPIEGTVAEAYLRARGITCALSDCLRFHPACWHPSAKRLPAMIARIEGAERFAVHRTYLRPDGSGKAQAEPSKAMLGNTAGGAVRLSACPGPLVVAEGIETALSLASGLLRYPASIWAALSTSGMMGLRLPATLGHLIVATDGDKPGSNAGIALAERAAALGWDVSTLAAPDGCDWNDVLMKKGAAA